MQQTLVALPIDGHLFACCANRRNASMRQLSSWAEESAHAASDEIIVDIAAAKIQLPFVEFTFVKRTRRRTTAGPAAATFHGTGYGMSIKSSVGRR